MAANMLPDSDLSPQIEIDLTDYWSLETGWHIKVNNKLMSHKNEPTSQHKWCHSHDINISSV